MALYLGSERVKLYLDGSKYYVNLFTKTAITNGAKLLSSGRLYLKDSKGLYLTAKDGE